MKKDDGISVSMEGYEKELITWSGITGVRTSPATADLFNVDKRSPALGQAEAKRFHTLVAKLLYLSLRTRPVISLSVSFLTTRVTGPTQEDMAKATRVVQYLIGSLGHPIWLSAKGRIRLESHIDAAFGIHED